MKSEKSFANKAVAELFVTPLWVYDLEPEDAQTVNEEILGWLDKVASPRPQATNDLSLQTDFNLHETQAFRTLGRFYDKAILDILKVMQVEDDKYLITGAWANISSPGIRHHQHTHPNNYLSAVYYVKTPEGGDTIRFYDPRPQAHVMQPQQNYVHQVSASTVTIDVKVGRLVFFFSWLQHSVDANEGDGERISVAINMMFRRFGERLAPPMWVPKIQTSKSKSGKRGKKKR